MRYEFDAPVSPSTLADLRRSVGWNGIARDLADLRLHNTFHLCCFEGNRLIGYAAVVGNGVTDAYIQDVMVQPEYHHQGIGTQLMERLLSRLKQEGVYMVSVIYGDETLRGFYEKFGFCTMLCGQWEMRPGLDCRCTSIKNSDPAHICRVRVILPPDGDYRMFSFSYRVCITTSGVYI